MYKIQEEQDGILEIVTEGEHNLSAMKTIFDDIKHRLSGTNDWKFVFNVNKFNKISPEATKYSIETVEEMPIKKMALYGNNVYIKYMVTFALKTMKKADRIKFFQTREEAFEWLRSDDE